MDMTYPMKTTTKIVAGIGKTNHRIFNISIYDNR
jgi:hypothetical protein